MHRRFQRAIAIAMGGSAAWPSYRGLLALFLLVRFFLSVGQHLSATLGTTFTMENLRVPYGDTVAIYMIRAGAGFLASVLVSTFVDRLAVFRVVQGASVIGAALRLLLAWDGGQWMPQAVQLIIICAALPLNDALFRLAVPVALKRILAIEYANDAALEQRRRNLFVAIFYALHNIGDIAANLVYYRWRTLGGVVYANTGVLYPSAAALLATAAIVTWMRYIAPRSDSPGIPLQETTHAMKSARFWRYLGTVLALVCVTSMFLHFELTLTKDLLVELGPGNPFPVLQSINPAMVFLLAAPVSWLLDRWQVGAFNALIVGTALSASGCLAMGILRVVPSVSAVAAYAVGLVIFSLGEVVWSPRVSSYALDVAPEGSEAFYQAVADLPNLLIVFIGPLMSHMLVDTYCSDTHCNGAMIWSILGLVAACTPFLLTLTRSWIED